MVIGLSAVMLAALTAGCGFYSDRTYAVRSEAAVAVPGAVYYGDRYAPYYYPTSTAYVRYY
jgi:hypothetical protein